MSDEATRKRLVDALDAQLRLAAGEAVPAVVRDYVLGSSGAVADLAVAAEELIGFLIHCDGHPTAALQERAALASRYCERVVVVAPAGQGPALDPVDLDGAALWLVDAAGALHEQRAGRANRIGPAALFDLMTPTQRARLLRPAISVGRYDRAQPPLSPAQVRTAFAANA